MNGLTTTYTWDLNSGLPVVLQDDTYTYVHGLGLISQTDSSDSQQYFLGDGLGSTRALTDGSGAVVSDGVGSDRSFRLCDEITVRKGSAADREVAQYREKSYRGLAVSFALLLVGPGYRALVPGGGIEVSGIIHSINLARVVLPLLLIAIAVVVRSPCNWKFRGHRIRQSFALLVYPNSVREEPIASPGRSYRV